VTPPRQSLISTGVWPYELWPSARKAPERKTPMPTADEIAEKEFAEQDKQWNAPKFFVTGVITLAIALAIIYYTSSLTGCSLQIVP
jgi:hypothetical protein